jgi:hypothetical protein
VKWEIGCVRWARANSPKRQAGNLVDRRWAELGGRKRGFAGIDDCRSGTATGGPTIAMAPRWRNLVDAAAFGDGTGKAARY